MVIHEPYCAEFVFGMRSAAVQVNEISEGKVDETNEKCTHVLVWVSFRRVP